MSSSTTRIRSVTIGADALARAQPRLLPPGSSSQSGFQAQTAIGP